MSDDDDRPTPGVVTGAVSVGTAPLPFLAVYTLLFLGHGLVHPVHPPDITNSQRGETIAGCVTGVLFALLVAAIVWFLNGRRRWPFVVLQLAVVVTGGYFLADSTKGGPAVSALLVVAGIIALALAFAPAAWRHVGRRSPRSLARGYGTVHLGPRGDDASDENVTGYSSAR